MSLPLSQTPFPKRLKALENYHIPDTPPEVALDDLMTLVAAACQATTAFCCFVDADQVWIKSSVGEPLPPIPDQIAFPTASAFPAVMIALETPQESNPTRFWASVPLITSTGLVLGAMGICDGQQRELTRLQEDVLHKASRQAMRILAGYHQLNPVFSRPTLATALGSEIDLIHQISEWLEGEKDLLTLLDQCSNLLVQSLNLAGVKIWTINRETQILELQAIAGQISPTEAFPHRTTLGISVVGFVAANRQIYKTNHLSEDVCIGATDWARQEQLEGFIGFPLTVEDRVIGMMAVFSSTPISASVEPILTSVKTLLAIAIDRARAREELLSRRESLLFRLASQIRNSLDLDEILTTAVREIRQLLKIERCHFLWCWTHQPCIVISHEACEAEMTSLLGESKFQQVAGLVSKIQNIETIQLDEFAVPSGLEDYFRDISERYQITSQLILPLETRSGQLGAIACSQGQGLHPWSDADVELLQAITMQLAIAIDQAELYAQTNAAAFAAQTQAQQLADTLTTLKSTQSQLIQHEKMSSLGQMVAGIAHEINNPVNFITGNLSHANSYVMDLLGILKLYQDYYPQPNQTIQAKAQEIDLEFLAEDLPKIFESMEIGAERIRQIVLSLRNFSRLDEADMKPVDIHEGIDNTIAILGHRLKPNGTNTGIQIIKIYSVLPKVNCYAGQLNQVFMNILANAIDVLNEGTSPRANFPNTPTIKIQTSLVSSNSVQIRISDNGLGIPDNIRQRLFDPFFTTKPVGKGTGLGLAISYQIVVEKHGGDLQCISEPGHGADFIIEIPLVPTRSEKKPLVQT